jgi:hypothetical protein
VTGRGGGYEKKERKKGKCRREERVKIKLNWKVKRKVKRKIGGILC